MDDNTGTELWREETPAGTPAGMEEAEAPPGAELLPPVEAEVDSPPPTSYSWLWAVPALILALLCAFLWVQNRAAAATVEALTTKVPQILVPANTENPLAGQLQIVRSDAQSHNFLQAKAHAEGLRPPSRPSVPPSLLPGSAPGTTPGAGPSSPQVTPQMAAYFRSHPDLEQRLGAYADQARALRDQGQDVQALRDLRLRILEAAEANDTAQVTRLLDQFGRDLEALGAPPLTLDNEMRQVMGQVQEAFGQAQKQGRDPSRGMALIRQAEAAARAGRRDQALALAKQALAALQQAPRMGRAGGGRMVRTGPPPGVAEQVLGMTMGVMRAEERDLSAAYAAIEEAARATRENNSDQIREILGSARQSLEQIRDRRLAFSAQLSRLGPQQPAPQPGAGQTASAPGTAPAPQPGHAPEPVEKIAALLDEVRKLPEDKYPQARLALARETLAVLLSLGPPAPAGAPAAGQSLTPAQERAAAQAESRIREKLQLLQGPYQERKRAGQDLTKLDALVKAAREALYDKRLAEAEKQADEALREVGLLPEAPPPASQS